MDTEATIRSAIEAYDAGDMERVDQFIADDVRYWINAQPDLGPYRADCHNKQEFFDVVKIIRDDWDILHFRIVDLIVAGDRGAVQIDIRVKSRHNTLAFDAHTALFLTVRNGQLCKISEYPDNKVVGMARDVIAAE
jgi:uncharacterized protein